SSSVIFKQITNKHTADFQHQPPLQLTLANLMVKSYDKDHKRFLKDLNKICNTNLK
ncbi:hypothetical protein L9F63_001872, partial [Diploptera punctata]